VGGGGRNRELFAPIKSSKGRRKKELLKGFEGERIYPPPRNQKGGGTDKKKKKKKPLGEKCELLSLIRGGGPDLSGKKKGFTSSMVVKRIRGGKFIIGTEKGGIIGLF